MKIFLDTASLKEIKDGAAWGVVDGVTTNPSLLAKEQGDPEEILLEICKTVDGPISAEVVATDLEGMLREGRHWAGVHKNITVKVPCTLDGLKATKALSAEGHKVNVTFDSVTFDSVIGGLGLLGGGCENSNPRPNRASSPAPSRLSSQLFTEGSIAAKSSKKLTPMMTSGIAMGMKSSVSQMRFHR